MPLARDDVGPFPPGRDHDEYDRLRRRVLWSLPTGLYVVGTRAGADRNMMTCNWVMQVATDPKLIAVAVEARSVTRGLIEEGGGFAVSILPRTERSVVRRFVKPVEAVEVDGDGAAVRLQGELVHEVAGGYPCLSVARAWLACEVRHVLHWDGDAAGGEASHVLVVGEVVDAGEAGPATGDADGTDGPADGDGVLRMEDTRMNYGG